MNLLNSLVGQAQQYLSYGQQLQAPAIQQALGLTGGGTSAVQAAGPQLGQVAQSGQAALSNLYNTTTPGAAQNLAADLIPQQTYSQSANLLNSLTQGAYGTLANAGSQYLNLGQGTTSQGLAAGQGAGSTLGQLGQEQAQGKASTLSFLGSLAGAGAGVASGMG